MLRHLLISRSLRCSTDFELALDAAFASFTIIRLCTIVFGHHFDELARQRRVLGFAYSQVSRRFVRLFFMLYILFDDCQSHEKGWRLELLPCSNFALPLAVHTRLPLSLDRTLLAVFLMSAIKSSNSCFTSVQTIEFESQLQIQQIRGLNNKKQMKKSLTFVRLRCR